MTSLAFRTKQLVCFFPLMVHSKLVFESLYMNFRRTGRKKHKEQKRGPAKADLVNKDGVKVQSS